MHFTAAGKLSSTNTSGTHTYRWRDVNIAAIPGVLYYRISQVDLDGRTEQSKAAKVVRQQSDSRWIATPNPFIDHLTIRLDGHSIRQKLFK